MSNARQTAGSAAGLPVDRSAFAIAPEPAYGALPSSVYQRLRLSGVDLTLAQERAYPEERNPRAERAEGVTTRFTGSGTLNGLLSFGSPDMLLAGALGSHWQDGTIVNGIERMSWTLRQRLGDGWLYRPGMVIRSLALSVAQGGFAALSCGVVYAREVIVPADEAAADDPTPSRLPMHSGAVRLDLTLPGQVEPGVLRSISITLGRDGTALDHARGRPSPMISAPACFPPRAASKSCCVDTTLSRRCNHPQSAPFLSRSSAGMAMVTSCQFPGR